VSYIRVMESNVILYTGVRRIEGNKQIGSGLRHVPAFVFGTNHFVCTMSGYPEHRHRIYLGGYTRLGTY
jgi:hypothetical protein